MKLSQAIANSNPQSYAEIQEAIQAVESWQKIKTCSKCIYMTKSSGSQGFCTIDDQPFLVRNFNLAKHCQYYKGRC